MEVAESSIGEVFFENVDGFEGLVHVGDVEVVDFGLGGEDEIGLSVKAEGEGVAGGGVEPFRAVRSGGLGRVFSVGFYSSFCRHYVFIPCWNWETRGLPGFRVYRWRGVGWNPPMNYLLLLLSLRLSAVGWAIPIRTPTRTGSTMRGETTHPPPVPAAFSTTARVLQHSAIPRPRTSPTPKV